MEDENVRDMNFPGDFEEVASKSGDVPSAAVRKKEFFSLNTLRALLPQGGYFLLCAVMTGVEFAFSSYPFGFALLCAAQGGSFVLAALLGVVIGSFFADGGAYVAGCALVIALARCALSLVEASSPSLGTTAHRTERPLTGRTLSGGVGRLNLYGMLGFTESLPVRCALSAAAAVVCGGAALLFRQNVYRAAISIVLSAVVSPVLCAAYSGAFSKRISRSGYSYFLLAMIFTLSYGLKGIGLFGFSPGAAFAMLCAMWGAWNLSLPEAVLCAFCAALPLDQALIPSVVLAALTAAVLRRFSSVLAAVGAMAVSLISSASAVGLSALSSVGAEYIFVCALCVPLGKLGLLSPAFARRVYASADSASPPADASDGGDERALEAQKKRLRSLGECFSSMSAVASSVAKALSAPSESEMRERVARAFDKSCASCRRQGVCWGGRGYEELSDFQKRLACELREGKRAGEVGIPPQIEERCPSIHSIIRLAALRRDGEGETPCRIFAEDWREMGELFSQASERLSTEASFDKAASRRLRTSLAMLGVEAARVAVYGERLRYVHITGVSASSLHIASEELRRLAENALGVRMSEPQISIEGEGLTVSMRAAERYRISVGRFLASAKVGACGDSLCAFYSDDGYFRAMISDGMGSGSEAAFTSGTVTLFLERLLSSGVKMDNAIAIVNSFLRQRKIESSATVDIMEVDLLRGNARFIKSGASPSFVLRRGRLFKLRSRTMPIGILNAADAEMIAFSVEAGDIVVMMSDGVTGTEEDCPWLYDILLSARPDSLTALAKRIADEASGLSEDDVSVMLISVEEA